MSSISSHWLKTRHFSPPRAGDSEEDAEEEDEEEEEEEGA